MSPDSQEKKQIRHLDHSVISTGIVIKNLQILGFEFQKRDWLFRNSNIRLRVDFVCARETKRYAVEVKSSRKMQLAFMHLLPRAILRLQALQRISDLLPIVALVVMKLEQEDVERMVDFMDFYAPEMGWLLVDRHGRAILRDREKNQYATLSEGHIEWKKEAYPSNRNFSDYLWQSLLGHFSKSGNSISYSLSGDSSRSSSSSSSPSSSMSVSSSRNQLSFSDLDQWLLKVFLLSPLGNSSDFWGGPQGIAENAFQLSKLAGVSSMLANSWVKAMESSEYLKRVGRKMMILLRPRSIIEEWTGRYRISDNRIFPCRSMYPISDYELFVDEILEEIRQHNKELRRLGITAHQACRLYGIKHSSARSIHIYFLEDIMEVVEALNLVPAGEGERPDLFLMEPKYPRSVFGGIVARDHIPVCDILQCYLDLFHLPDRGREQANMIYESVLSRIIDERQGNLVQ